MPTSAPAQMSRFQSTRPIRGATCAQSIVEFAQDISIHAPHTGRDTPWSTPWTGSPYFNPRAPYGARRGRTGEPIRGAFISIHAPHTGRDLGYGLQVRDGKLFQSTRPIRGATSVYEKGAQFKTISTHAPHTGRDPRRRRRWDRGSDFNPRAPYGARRVQYPITIQQQDLFQSTRPIRGATPFLCVVRLPRLYFNPRAPYGARLFKRLFVAKVYKISIHAPHTGRDHKAVLA